MNDQDLSEQLEEYRATYRAEMMRWLKSYGAEFVDNPKAYMGEHVVDAMMSTTTKQKEAFILERDAIEYEPALVDAQFAIFALRAEHERMNQEHMTQSFCESI